MDRPQVRIAVLCLTCLQAMLMGASAQDLERSAQHWKPGQTHGRSVCIVGAGASGLASAIRLRQKGYTDIIVFEREAAPGGKAVTLTFEDNEKIYLGAVLGAYASYPNTLALMNKYGITYTNISSTDYFTNYETGFIAATASLPTNRTAIVEAVGKFLALRQQYVQYLVPGYRNGAPAELLGSFGSYVKTNGLDPILPLLYVVLVAYGYGSLDTLPTLYAMDVLDQGVMQGILQSPPFFITDYAELWRRTANDLASQGVRFRYNANLISVKRVGRGKFSVRYTTAKASTRHNSNHGVRIEKCDKVIAAIPPSPKNLAAFDLDAAEMAVFGRVKLVQYWSGAINMPKSTDPNGRLARVLKLTGNPSAPFTLAEMPGDGLPALYRSWGTSPIKSFWTWVAGDAPVSTDQIAANAVATLSKFNRAANEPVTAATPLTAVDMRAIRGWDYFAHFNVQTISTTVFQELENLQGRYGVYYTSSLRCFEVVEKVVESAYDIVDRYF